jgi:hypothetical protein
MTNPLRPPRSLGLRHRRLVNSPNAAGVGRARRVCPHAQRLWIFCLTLTTLLALATDSPASVGLDIQIVGLSFKYDESQNGSLFDSNSIAGGHGNISEATRVSQIDFSLGNQLVGSLMNSEGLYCDFLVQGIKNIPKAGGLVNATASGPDFGFDLLTSTQGRFLALDLETVTVNYIRTQTNSTVKFSFMAGGPSATLLSQNLPFGLVIDPGEPISIVVSSRSVSNRIEVGDYVTAFSTSGGTADVYGDQVPEPAGFAILLGIGVLGLEFQAWRKRSQHRVSSSDAFTINQAICRNIEREWRSP